MSYPPLDPLSLADSGCFVTMQKPKAEIYEGLQCRARSQCIACVRIDPVNPSNAPISTFLPSPPTLHIQQLRLRNAASQVWAHPKNLSTGEWIKVWYAQRQAKVGLQL